MRAFVAALGSPIRWALTLLITGYRRYISPMMAPRCRYYPSCSSYGLQSVQTHGAVKGVLLTTWRVLRCNPWSGGGVDPVPDKGHWLPPVYPNGRPRPAGASAESADPSSSAAAPGPTDTTAGLAGQGV